MAAVALHEYDYGMAGMSNVYPWHIGRFQELFKVCDQYQVKRPKVLITEFGWAYNDIPPQAQCMNDIDFAAKLYAKYPTVLGAAVWYLGPGFSNIANKVQPLIAPVTAYALNTTFPDPEPTPPGGSAMTWQQELWNIAESKRLIAFNPTAALQAKMTIDGFNVAETEFDYTRPDGVALKAQLGISPVTNEGRVYYAVVPHWDNVQWFSDPAASPEPPSLIYDSPVGTSAERATAQIWPGRWLDANPYGNRYQFGNPLKWAVHTGADLNLNFPGWNDDANDPVYAIADGVVTFAQLVFNSNGQVSTWGKLVVVEHPDGTFSRYGHLRTLTVSAGQPVTRGQRLGTIGGSEYGVPDHSHFDISTSGALRTNPTYWPGDDLPAVQQHFVDPKVFIQERHTGTVTPPAGVDMAPYFLPAVGDFGDTLILKNSWGAGDERSQLQRSGNLAFIVKNSQWERRRIANDGIYLELDTSPGNGEYYTVTGSPWLPLSWSVGNEHTRTEAVKFFRKSDCGLVRQGGSTNAIRFEHHYPVWTSPAGIQIADVIELAWIVGGVVEERYRYGRNLGLVGWENRAGLKSWVTEVIPVGQQESNVREQGCFG